MRVGRPERLREDVLHARRLEDRAHRASRDDTGPLRRRLEHHAAGAVVADDRVRDRLSLQGDADHLLLGHLDPLLDGHRDLLRLAGAVADAAVPVADDDERGEGEVLAALDDLGHPVDVDDVVDQVGAGAAFAERACGTGRRTAGTAGTVPAAGRTRGSVAAQNFNPFSRAASASAFTLPW